jgi:hypothetical protein
MLYLGGMSLTFKQTLIGVGLGAAVLLAGAGNAKNTYRLAAVAQYKLEPDREDGTRVVACTYCHINSTGAAPWNPFGLNLRETFRRESTSLPSDQRIKNALYKVLVKKLDSDSDGYPDALEVYAGTLPGNSLSSPTRDVDELEKAFTDSGGYAQFKAPESK